MFEPINKKHSVVEAVIGFVFVKPLNPAEFVEIDKRRGLFSEQLPRVSRIDAMNINIGPVVGNNLPVPAVPGGVIFDRIRPNGEIAWRLKIEGNSVFVNCLTYEGRDDFFPYSFSLIEKFFTLAADFNIALQSCLLQYINEFNWTASQSEYDLSLLFKSNGSLVPSAVFGHGPLWHSHQGWFEPFSEPIAGKILKRCHIDGLLRPNGPYFVRSDITTRLDYASPIGLSTLKGNMDSLTSQGSTLHAVIKGMFGDYLTDEMAARVDLWK